jgi:hypothetical protein
VTTTTQHENQIEVVRYSVDHQRIWNDFLSNSKTGVFFFHRNYMDYHSDRFKDNSLLFYRKDRLLAMLPANLKDDTLYSHQGLTFGGVISPFAMKTDTMMQVFSRMIKYAGSNGIKKIIYKAVPHIYPTIPAEEDLYALSYYGAKLARRDVTTTIDLKSGLPFDTNRARTIKKAKMNDIVVHDSTEYESFMGILEQVLMKRHNVKPVHSISEIKLLASRFPDHIRLFGAYRGNHMVAGVVVYESSNVAHAQYIASSDEGRQIGALDLLFDHLINRYRPNKRFFDFGISTEKEGHFLNEGLIRYKEGFGGSAVAHDFYELSVTS